MLYNPIKTSFLAIVTVHVPFLYELQVGQNHSLSVSHDSVKPPNKFSIPLSNVGESPYPLQYLKNPALFCCALFSKEHFKPIRSTKWWTKNADFQPKTFSIALNATTSHIFTDPLGLDLSPEYLLHFSSWEEMFELLVLKLLENEFVW